MTNKHPNLTILPKMMAVVLALSLPVGCTALPGGPTGMPYAQQQTAAGQQSSAGGQQAPATASTQAANDAQTASQINREMDDTDMMADSESGFATQALPRRPLIAAAVRAAVRAELRADARAAIKGLNAERKAKLLARGNELRQKASTRLKATADAFKKGMEKTVTDNDLGGKTFSATFDFTHTSGQTRSGSIERIFNGDKVLVSAKQVQDWKAANGNTRHMERTKELQADGSYKIAGTATLTVNGKTRTYTWSKTISAEGGVSGTGTLTRFNGGTVTITIGGTEAKESCTATDPTTQVAATVEASAEAGADTSATVTDPATNTTAEVTVEAEAAVATETATEPAPAPAPGSETAASADSSTSTTADAAVSETAAT